MNKLLWLICISGIPGMIFAQHLPTQDFRKNPATLGWWLHENSSRLEISYRNENNDNGFHSLYEGNNSNLYRIRAEGIQSDTNRSIYSGTAAYERGQKQQVQWTDVWNTELLYPYLIADSLGGDYTHEQYLLGGSWAGHFGKNTAGLAASYQGTTAWREKDPRPKNTVSLLRLTPGWAYNGKQWQWGIFLNYTFYKQNLSVSIAEPNQKEYFYILKGFGQYDNKFSSLESSIGRYYRSQEWNAGLQLKRERNKSWALQIEYGRNKMEAEESDYRIPYTLKKQNASVQFIFNPGAEYTGGWWFGLTGKQSNHQGKETIYTQVENNTQNSVKVWQVLSESEKYKKNHQQLHAGAGNYIFTEHNRWYYGLKVKWNKEVEKYSYPAYEQNLQNILCQLTTSLQHTFQRGTLEIALSGGYKKNLHQELLLPLTVGLASRTTVPEFEFLRKDYGQARLALAYTFPLAEKVKLTFFANGSYSRSGSQQTRTIAETGLCATF